MFKSTGLRIIVGLLAASAWGAQAPQGDNVWTPYRFLVGEWIGGAGGSGDLGQGGGTFSFQFELDSNILVRKSHTEFPGTAARPAIMHDDLLVIYPDSQAKRMNAIYWDNEGHIINYTAEYDADQRVLKLISDSSPSAPRFRLTYRSLKADSLGIKFEIAPPGKPDAFSTHLEGSARRK
jgi:hypothetical protein